MSEKSLLILGMGLQGKGALHDVLTHQTFSRVTVADFGPRFEAERSGHEARGVRTAAVDANDTEALRSLLAEHDIVIELLPVDFAMKVVSSMYYIGQSMTDPELFRRMKEEMAEIDSRARQSGTTLLIACGMDPGLDLILGADALSRLDEIDLFASYGAGFPEASACDNPLPTSSPGRRTTRWYPTTGKRERSWTARWSSCPQPSCSRRKTSIFCTNRRWAAIWSATMRAIARILRKCSAFSARCAT